jgi:hypothetical protein
MIGIVVLAVVVIHHLRTGNSRRIARVASIDNIDPIPKTHDAAITLREMTHAPTPEKSWVTEGDQSDGDMKLIVGHTPKPAVTEAEALREARKDVENRVAATVSDALRPDSFDSHVLRVRIAADVAAGRFEVDRYAEKFDRPYGQLWTEAVLVDLSPDKLNPAIAQYRQDLQLNRNRVRGHWVGLAAITLLVLFGYTLSNAITRGYFTGRLRLMALLVVVLGAAALI